jgi:hypothetical protein
MSNCQAVRSYIENIVQNDFYTVTFVKKTDGSIRKMNCRQNVSKHSKGGVNPCAGKEDLMPTYSMDAKGYRTISLASVIEISHNGSVIKF